MKSLIIDSATKVLYVCLVDDSNVLFEKYVNGQNDHAKRIVSLVDEALKLNNLTALELDEVIVGVGPGSYTGVRMGVTVGKMISSLSSVKLKSISTLKLMSSGYSGVTKAMVDARRGNAFTGYYEDMMPLCDEELKEVCDEAFKYDNLCNESQFIVDPIKVIKYAFEVENPFTLIPNYLRQTEAERNL